MKNTKKALKAIFESDDKGLAYLQRMANNQTTPILFISGAGANAFADWAAQIHGGASFISIDELIAGKGSGSLLIIKNGDDFTDPAIQAALNARSNGKNLIVATNEQPKAIAYVRDTSFVSLYTDTFNASDMGGEIAEVRDALS